MPLIRKEKVFPLYAQIEFGDALAQDYPESVTGEEAVLFNTQTIVVATREDRFGDVDVEIWTELVGADITGTQILEIEIQADRGDSSASAASSVVSCTRCP